MKSLLCIFFLFCLSCLSAQEKHFVFIQSDNHQPFYVSLNGKLHSSTAKGYVIIPKLVEGDYNFSIGFAQNAFPEQSFEFVINNKDLGFDLKNFGEKGWGLFNLQSLTVTMAESGKTDDISKALSEKAIAKEDTDPVISFDKKKKNTIAEQDVTKNAADTLTNGQAAKNENQKDEEINSNTAVDESKGNNDFQINNDVKKVSESNLQDGLHLAYVEGDGKNNDTIQVIIPSDKSDTNQENNGSSAVSDISDKNVASAKDGVSENVTAAKDSLKFLDINTRNAKKDTDVQSTVQQNEVSITNSKCKNIATDEDYTRLRRKMAKESTDEKMISEARKMYRNKCFTTNQIKRLSTLFLSDEGRYNFFNASYNSVADASQYSLLQSEFIDPAFVSRFKAILQ